MVIVGGFGLLSNIVGLFLFHGTSCKGNSLFIPQSLMSSIEQNTAMDTHTDTAIPMAM